MCKKILVLLIFFSCWSTVGIWAQQQAVLRGHITDENGIPLSAVSIVDANSNSSAMSDSLGNYLISIPSGKKVYLRATLFLYEKEFITINKAQAGDTITKNITMDALDEVLQEVIIRNSAIRSEAGGVDMRLKNVELNPSPVGGIEGLIKTMMGSNNELTSQYTVRGGNFDENLVYVNDFEIYRPFLVRSGQQEGLSFVNSDLTERVNFSIGGFQSKYGDKLSSVLDVTYKTPKKFAGSAILSFLGAQAHIEGTNHNKKLTYLFGARQKSNQYLLQSQPIKGQYTPTFTDIQGLVNYKFNAKWEIEFLANYARNRFNFIPEESSAAFGFATEAYELYTVYNGGEVDQFDSRFGGLSLTYRPTEKSKLKILASNFETNEFETYDIHGEYAFYALEADMGKEEFGQRKFSLGTGQIHDYARNYLTASVTNIGLRGSHDANKHYIQWGVDGSFAQINDKMLEWQRRDSAGFTQPANPDSILMNKVYTANNQLEYERFAAFIQDNILLGKMMTLNLGVRANYTVLNKELIISPRVQYSVKPDWERDIVFRMSAGMYAQPAFYREMRTMEGDLNTELKAQKSFHSAAGFDYNFSMWDNRPFKITAEVFYKELWDLVPYEYDNVRIRYYANNNGKGYAYGGEVRLYGDLVKDAESWISVGYLKTEQKILDPSTGAYSAFMPRPTDQRLNFGMFFSDYLPRNKNFKMFLNLIYATGLPFSPASKGLDPAFQYRIPDYKRVDIGFAALLIDGAKNNKPAYSLFSNLKSVWLTAEVFNLLGIMNTLSYQWIQDYSTLRTYAIPNRLTARLINLKLAVRF